MARFLLYVISVNAQGTKYKLLVLAIELCNNSQDKTLFIERYILMLELSKMYILESVKDGDCPPYDPAIALLGIYSKKWKIYV